jgi:type I restriction enzyme S subunit
MKISPYGQISKNWEIQLLKELCLPAGIQTGPFGSQLHQKDYLPVGTPIITVEHLGENHILHTNLPRVSDEDKNRLSRYVMQKGDIIFSRVGTVDRRSLVRDEEDGWLFSGRCLRVRPDPKKIISEYLSWFFGLVIFKDYIRRIAVGATMPSLNTDLLSDVPVIVPPLPEQRAIADVLGVLDDKIELNRSMNATLKSMVWAIFKSWFVDFYPIYTKANGRHPAGMDIDTERLFPEIINGGKPKGWNLAQFGDFLTPISDRIGSEDAPEYSATVNSLSLRGENFNKTLSKSKEKNKKIVKNNLVFGLSRQTLNFGVMKEEIGSVSPVYEIFNIDTNFFIPELLEMYIRLKMDEYIDILKPAAREGQAIDRNYLLTKKIIVPDIKVQIRYQEFCSPFRDKIAHNEKESHTLANLREALLPKLMSGDVRIKEL